MTSNPPDLVERLKANERIEHLENEVDRLEFALAYLTNCTAATVEGFTKRTSKGEQHRHYLILGKLIAVLQGERLNVHSSGLAGAIDRATKAKALLERRKQ